MVLLIDNHAYKYDLETLCRVFFPREKIVNHLCEDDKIVIRSSAKETEHTIQLEIHATVFGKASEQSTLVVKENDIKDYKACQLAFCVLLYKALGALLDYYPRWGILTGVRTTKVMRHVMEEQRSAQGAQAYFEEKLLVTPQKAALALEVALAQSASITASKPNFFSLYISIPFCPTRCSYCSFVSQSMKSVKPLIDPYVAFLLKELEHTAVIAKQLGLQLETVYFGGGTPTTLEAHQLSALLEGIHSYFDLSHLKELTVEAGRPDTITEKKLKALLHGGVTRISINPQSFHDEVLQAIGRSHTAEQTLEAFALAREVGFQNINMDFIAGLPMDSLKGFRQSIQTAIDLGADSITVHTLAMKRASFMVRDDLLREKQDFLNVNAMVDDSATLLRQAGYAPYYMYRQSKTAGNLENVGWSKPGAESLYNIYMMDETHSIFACGAGAVSVLRAPNANTIERIYNYKYPFEYNRNFLQMIERKERIKSFYQEY